MLSDWRAEERPDEQGATLAGVHQKVGDCSQGLSSGSDPREKCGSLGSHAVSSGMGRTVAWPCALKDWWEAESGDTPSKAQASLANPDDSPSS